MTRTVRAVVLVALAVAGCGTGEPEQSDEAGLPLPQQLAGEDYPGVRSPFTGRMVVASNGCFRAVTDGEERVVVWPAGSEHDGDGVVLPGGDRLGDGTRFRATGAVMPSAALEGGFWPDVLGYCAPGEPAVLVLDDVRLGQG